MGMTSDLVKKGTAKREKRTLVMVIIFHFLLELIKNILTSETGFSALHSFLSFWRADYKSVISFGRNLSVGVEQNFAFWQEKPDFPFSTK